MLLSVQTQTDGHVQANVALKQTIAVASGLMISRMGVLWATSGNPVNVDCDMNSSHTLNISYVYASHLYVSTMTCTH